jgi:hypothetical protein
MTRLLPLCLALALALAACTNADAPPGAAAQPVAQEAAAPASDARSSGEGTLTLDGTSYPFTVIVCDLSGDADDEYQTLVGRGTTPEGEAFSVFVSRNDIGGILSHSVSYQKGDVRSGASTVIEAQRLRMGGAWSSMRGGAAEPLIVIHGNRVTAEGRFSSDDDLEATVPGRLEARCD